LKEIKLLCVCALGKNSIARTFSGNGKTYHSHQKCTFQVCTGFTTGICFEEGKPPVCDDISNNSEHAFSVNQ
jgi:hypothetical protein